MNSWKVVRLIGALGAVLLLTSCVSGASTQETQGMSRQHGLAVGQAGDPSEADRTIAVTTLDSMAYDPESITVSAGDTILFVVSNEGNMPHEFALGDKDAQVDHATEMSDPNMTSHDHPFSVYLEPGQTKELAWTFMHGGKFLYGCHVPGHYEAGMKAGITVE